MVLFFIFTAMSPNKAITVRNVLFLMALAIFIYFPAITTHYGYSDEILQLWLYRKEGHFFMFIPQGRYLTNLLCQFLYSSIERIDQLRWLHAFSLAGWLACLPLWYNLLSKVCHREGLPFYLPFLSLLFLITCPSFSVSISWAACMELFIANTAGLVSGYIIYSGLAFEQTSLKIPWRSYIPALFFGLIALFTYQNGFGCFLLPFLLHIIARKRVSKFILIGIGAYLLTTCLYFLLFKWQVHMMAMESSERTGLMINPFSKLWFFFTRPMVSVFHLNILVNELNKVGVVLSGIICIVLGIIIFKRMRPAPAAARYLYLTAIVVMLILIYLPSMVVRENYGSNRTLLALFMAAFLLLFTTAFEFMKQPEHQQRLVILGSCFFIIVGFYNFRHQFLNPVKSEYDCVRNFFDAHYTSRIKSVEFLRPPEELIRRKFGVTTSWDEFGVASTYFEWVPEFLVKQMVFEKTGDRSQAERLVINKHPAGTWSATNVQSADSTVLVVDVAGIMAEKTL